MKDFPRIGKSIKELRQLRGWSRRELAKRSGICRSTLKSYESGQCNPTLKKLCAVAEAFDAKPSGLLADAGL
jgi:transcriptional regulator with XRE-family HTH domain